MVLRRLEKRDDVKEAMSSCNTAICWQWALMESVAVEHLHFLKPCKAHKPPILDHLASQVSKMSWVGYSPALAVALAVSQRAHLAVDRRRH